MEKKTAKKRIIQSVAIQQINEATIVLRHFIELSAKLLPLFYELSIKENLTIQEQDDRNKISEVYKNYRFDTSTSLILMKSDILETIQYAFESIDQGKPKEITAQLIQIFEEKHNILVKEWNLTDRN